MHAVLSFHMFIMEDRIGYLMRPMITRRKYVAKAQTSQIIYFTVVQALLDLLTHAVWTNHTIAQKIQSAALVNSIIRQHGVMLNRMRLEKAMHAAVQFLTQKTIKNAAQLIIGQLVMHAAVPVHTTNRQTYVAIT